MKLPCLFQWRILRQAVKSLLSRPFTTRFPAEPYEPIERFRGRPRFNAEECIGCGACAQVCPSKCIYVEDDPEASPPVRRLNHRVDECIWCGQCERYCPTGGIRMTNEYDCTVFSREELDHRIEKELVICEVCSAVIAPLDQLRWLVKKLGPLAYGNPTLMLVGGRELKVVEPGVRPSSEDVLRQQRVSIACPRCRRKTSLVV
ncbi:MAG TPA: 4Fe-4S dicluster domain-containing protein [Lentisphaerae bacterium]|nr:4Fe-4S dicluster domain-containing protein [Lentisphaerota bacterium]